MAVTEKTGVRAALWVSETTMCRCDPHNSTFPCGEGGQIGGNEQLSEITVTPQRSYYGNVPTCTKMELVE